MTTLRDGISADLHKAIVAAQTPGADGTAIARAGMRIAKAVKAGELPGTAVRVGLLSSFMVDFLKDILTFHLFERGIVARFETAPYGTIAADLLGQQAVARNCDILVICPTHRDLVHRPPLGSSANEAQRAAGLDADFWAGLWEKVSCPVVQLTFDPPPTRPLAELDGFSAGGHLNHVRRVNQALFARLPAHVSLIDAEALATSVEGAWHDTRNYFLFKQPLGQDAMHQLSQALAGAIAARRGLARKALVLDLDNTLWGGVIGDEGVSGIEIGKETFTGEAFSAFQQYVKTLSDRGVILAVVSKNKEEVAKEPFRSHSGMVLKLDDIACFVANFDDKATGIKRVAQALNIGLDALVFVDDNPVERELVRRELPSVLVVDLPTEPAGYCSAVERTFSFPMAALTSEDLARNKSYVARAQVLEAQSSATDMDSFLRDLNPRLTVERMAPQSSDRITQLLAKTNQFKLNAENVFSATDLADPRYTVLGVAFADRLQAYGIVSVVVMQNEGDDLVLSNWVMSCRVFSRRLEFAIMDLVRQHADAGGRTRIVARYKPTGRNEVALEHLTAVGFRADETGVMCVPVEKSANEPAHYIAFQ